MIPAEKGKVPNTQVFATWSISIDRELKFESNESKIDVIESLDDVIIPKQKVTQNHYFVIMTSPLESMMPNHTSIDSVFDSASTGSNHVTMTSLFLLLPVST